MRLLFSFLFFIQLSFSLYAQRGEKKLPPGVYKKENSISPLPLPSLKELGPNVNYRHGWTCIFDNSLDVDKWVQAWQAVGINYIEFHSWMRAHEELTHKGKSWNAYVGDYRLWTSKAKMQEKIQKFQNAGGKAICYTGIYAASPAFAYQHPAWAMRNISTNKFITYAGDYLNLMCINPKAYYPYKIDGKSFNNFNDYLIYQAILSEKQYNWDGWRWDWYGIPSKYKSDALGNQLGDFTYEMDDFTAALGGAVKTVRPDCMTTALQLPHANNDTPNIETAAVVDNQFMELWPEDGGTGKKYEDLYREIYRAKTHYPKKMVFANFYPPQYMNLQKSWSKTNINYQFATCLSAGGYPSAVVVDGVAGFTDPLPFHAVRYSDSILHCIAQWNRFVEAYSGYFFFSNPIYTIQDAQLLTVNGSSSSKGLVCRAKERTDNRNGKTDALIIHVINYGDSTGLRWEQENNLPQAVEVNLTITTSAKKKFLKAYTFSPFSLKPVELKLLQKGNTYSVEVPSFAQYAMVLLTTAFSPQLPMPPQPAATSFPGLKFEYDIKGSTLRNNEDTITVFDEDGLISQANYFDRDTASWSFSTDAYSGKKSIQMSGGRIYFMNSERSAIRFPVAAFKNFQIAVKPGNSTASWFGFRLFNPADRQTKDIYYQAGENRNDLEGIPIAGSSGKNGWQVLSSTIYDDILRSPAFGERWKDAVVVGLFLGPVKGDASLFDALKFYH